MTGSGIKNTMLALIAGIGSIFSEWLGGWDIFLKTLVIFMVVDYITGLAVAFIFRKSDKTENGGASSRECYKGIVKKMCILALVGVSVGVDNLAGSDYIRNVTILFFLGNEGLSILENIGLMGLKYPHFVKTALEVIRERGDSDGEI